MPLTRNEWRPETQMTLAHGIQPQSRWPAVCPNPARLRLCQSKLTSTSLPWCSGGKRMAITSTWSRGRRQRRLPELAFPSASTHTHDKTFKALALVLPRAQPTREDCRAVERGCR